MAKSWEVINYLRPEGGVIAVGQNYEGIEFVSAIPFSKEEYEAGFAECDAWKAEQEAAAAAAKKSAESKLEALGLTPEDLAALGL
tara:strand:- start:8 stop:262 length:255 start_codon:yes stop_codon:yes gene_type:complete